MTPPPANAANPSDGLRLRGTRGVSAVQILARLSAPRTWAWMCVLIDVIVLYGDACLVRRQHGPARHDGSLGGDAVPADCAWPTPYGRGDHFSRLSGASAEAVGRVLGVTSLAAMLTVALAATIGGVHTISLPLRLWLFSVVYLGAARIAVRSVHRQLMSCTSLSTPTLIVGAGVVGDRVVKRLQRDTHYGLRPVGFIDADPMVHGASC